MIDSGKRFCVYCHTNRINGKRYVGITSRVPEKRWGHGKEYKHNAHFTNAILKYGWDNFSHDIIAANVDEEYAKSLEKMLINFYQSADRRYGYNKSTGGESGSGVAFTLEQQYNFIHSHDGKPSWNKGICGKESHSYGVVFSDERKKHISEVLKGKPKSAEHREHLSTKVRYIPTGEVFKSMRDASSIIGTPVTSISNHCRGIVRNPKWEYVKEA